MSFFFPKKKMQPQTKIVHVFMFCFVFFCHLGKNMVPKPSSQVAQTKTGERRSVSDWKLVISTLTTKITMIILLIF